MELETIKLGLGILYLTIFCGSIILDRLERNSLTLKYSDLEIAKESIEKILFLLELYSR